MSLIKMYSVTELHMDNWSGNEEGKTLYFRDEIEATSYTKSYHDKYNNKGRTPEYYMTFYKYGWCFVEADNLVLEHDSLGMYYLEKIS